MDHATGRRPPWLAQAAERLRSLSSAAGEDLQAGLKRVRQLHAGSGYHIDTYRGMVAADGSCTLGGRVLERPLGRGPGSTDDWWDNLLNSYRRYDSEHLAGASVDVSFRGQTVSAVTDAEGYYEAVMPPTPGAKGDPAPGRLWETAEVRRSEGGKAFLQPVLCVPAAATFGVISDIDDTILEGNASHWQTAIQMTFLRNARTRKPLEGVGKLYQAFQKGRDGAGPNPVFYVSASPWNVYDLLVDFMELNGLPPGPILLRDIDFDRASLLNHAGPHSKLAKIHGVIDKYPALHWVLVGDSAQIDAELYAQTVDKYPGRVLAVYIRDVDPASDSARDRFVDGHIGRIAGSRVPMLRVANSNAIAEHARTLGLIEPEEIEAVAKDVERDQARPDITEAVTQGLGETAGAAVAASLAADAPPAAGGTRM